MKMKIFFFFIYLSLSWSQKMTGKWSACATTINLGTRRPEARRERNWLWHLSFKEKFANKKLLFIIFLNLEAANKWIPERCHGKEIKTTYDISLDSQISLLPLGFSLRRFNNFANIKTEIKWKVSRFSSLLVPNKKRLINLWN